MYISDCLSFRDAQITVTTLLGRTEPQLGIKVGDNGVFLTLSPAQLETLVCEARAWLMANEPEPKTLRAHDHVHPIFAQALKPWAP